MKRSAQAADLALRDDAEGSCCCAGTGHSAPGQKPGRDARPARAPEYRAEPKCAR